MGLWKWASERDLIVSAVDLWGLRLDTLVPRTKPSLRFLPVFGSLPIRCCLA